MLEVLRVNSGGYFQSQDTVLISVYIIVEKLKKKKWKTANRKILSMQYELNQIYAAKFKRSREYERHNS